MAIDIDRLRSLVEQEDLKYFLAPDRPAVMMGFGGKFGRYQVVVKVEVEGRFLQCRTVGYLGCPVGHPHLDAVLRLLGEVNYRLRLVKFGWDPSDGEIVGYCDLWVEDGEVTLEMFRAMLRSLLPAIDMTHRRLQAVMETGNDPGEYRPDDPYDKPTPPPPPPPDGGDDDDITVV